MVAGSHEIEICLYFMVYSTPNEVALLALIEITCHHVIQENVPGKYDPPPDSLALGRLQIVKYLFEKFQIAYTVTKMDFSCYNCLP